MQALYVSYEECAKDKEKVETVLGYSALHFVLSGEGFFNGERLTAGQGFIAYENQYAEYYPNPENPWTYAWLRVTNCEILQEYGNIFSWQMEKKNEIINIVKSGKNGNQLYLLGCAYMLFSYIENKEQRYSTEEKHVLDAQNYIKACYKEISSAQLVADKLGLTRAYLRNLFYAKTGMSTKEYIIKTRLEHAANMLKTDYPIKMIAYSVGYDDQLQFSRIFKKYMGVSPNEYRKKESNEE